MKKIEAIILYGLLALVVVTLIFSISTFFTKGNSDQNYNKLVSAELQDKCQTPPGYTDAEWKEHMGHHPDRYKECLT